MPQSDLPFVLVGCRLERACAHFSPNQICKKLHKQCGTGAEEKTDYLVENG
jgi:hypothetical protein